MPKCVCVLKKFHVDISWRVTAITALSLSGYNCEEEIDECEVQPCLNGATCQDYVAMYMCECMTGFQGKNCEINIDECDSMPCQNEGKCIDGVNR